MSVINKMLKDLEQRESDQPAQGSPSAVYQPAKNNNSKLLTLILLLVCVSLAAVVIWLLNDKQQEPAQNMPVQVAVEPTPVAETSLTEPTETKPEELKPEPAKVMSSSPSVQSSPSLPSSSLSQSSTGQGAEPEQNNVAQAATQAEQAQTAPVEVPQQGNAAIVNAEPESMVLLPESSEVVVAEPVTPEPAITTAEQTEPQKAFVIERSNNNLTRQQRIDKLMEKAQSSFDKGYITDAIAQLEQLLTTADNHVEARNLLAVAWYGRGELQQAITILNNGLNRYPNIEAWRLTAAKMFFKDNQIDGAFSYLETDLPGASAEYYSMKASLARQLRRFDKAESAYARLIQLQPNRGNWYLGHGIALDSQGKAEQALESYRSAIDKAGLSQASVKFAQQRIEILQG